MSTSRSRSPDTPPTPTIRFTPSGNANVRIRVAVNSRYQVPLLSWYTVPAWAQLPENVAESISKGDRVIVHGRLEQRDYETEAADKRT